MDDSEVLTPNAVINTGSLNFMCVGTPGNRDLQWEAVNISGLNNGEITPEEAASFPGFNITYLINSTMYLFDRSFILLNSPPATPLVMGYISCRSRQSGRNIEVFVTPVNPLWRVISAAQDAMPLGAQVKTTLQYGENSIGSRNVGPGFIYSLRFLPCVATQPDETLLMGITDDTENTLEYSFRARLMDSGEFRWNGMMAANKRCPNTL